MDRRSRETLSAIFAQLVTEGFTPNGRVRYVDSNHAASGDSDKDGSDWRNPMDTLNAAYAKCIAGDVVLALPGHAEPIASAASLVPNINGVATVGLGRGSRRPTLTFNATTSKIVISGTDNLFKGFLATITGAIDVVLGIHVTGAGSIVKDVELREPAATSQFVLPLHVAAADVLVERYKFLGAAGNGTVAGMRLSAADRAEVRDCDIVGDFQGLDSATGAIQSLTTANLNLRIHHNRLENRDGTSIAGIVFVATDTGWVYENFIAIPTGTFGKGIVVDTLMRQYNNYVVDVATERGAPEGTASA